VVGCRVGEEVVPQVVEVTTEMEKEETGDEGCQLVLRWDEILSIRMVCLEG